MVKEVKEFTVECPWSVELPRKTKANKKVPINLNTYRNIHHSVNNDAKKALADIVAPQLKGVSLKTPVNVTVQVMKPSRRRLDKHNIYSVAAKYLYDAMTDAGVWPDDNDDYVKTETILPTILDPDKKGKIVFTFHYEVDDETGIRCR